MAAYAMFFAILTILFAGVVIVNMNVVINEMNTVMNVFISTGEVTDQFITYWNFGLGLWLVLPILIIFAIAIWAYVRAIERRQEGGF